MFITTVVQTLVWYLPSWKAPAIFTAAAKDDGLCSFPPSLCSAWLIVSNCHIFMTTSTHLSLQCCKIDNCVPEGNTIEKKKRQITDTLAQHIVTQCWKSITEDVCEGAWRLPLSAAARLILFAKKKKKCSIDVFLCDGLAFKLFSTHRTCWEFWYMTRLFTWPTGHELIPTHLGRRAGRRNSPPPNMTSRERQQLQASRNWGHIWDY